MDTGMRSVFWMVRNGAAVALQSAILSVAAISGSTSIWKPVVF